MDPISLVYYAVICAALSWCAPQMQTGLIRLAVGAVVGMIAAGALPSVQSMLGVGY